MRSLIFSLLSGFMLVSCANVESTGGGGAPATPGKFEVAALLENVCSDELQPVQDFACNAKWTFYGCRIQIRQGLLNDKGREEGLRCISEQQQRMDPLYAEAKAQLQGDAQELAEVENFYRYWQTSLNTLIPVAGEHRIQYETKVDAIWSTLSQRADQLAAMTD